MSGTSQVLAVLLVVVLLGLGLVVLERRTRRPRSLTQTLYVDHLAPTDLRGPRAQGGAIPDLSDSLRLAGGWARMGHITDSGVEIRDHRGSVVRSTRPAALSPHAVSRVWDFPRAEAMRLQRAAAYSPYMTPDETFAVDALTITTPRTRAQAIDLVLAGRAAGIHPWQVLVIDRQFGVLTEHVTRTWSSTIAQAQQAMHAFARHFMGFGALTETDAERRRRERRELRDAQRAARDPRQSAMWSEYRHKTRRRNRRRRNR